LNEKLRMAMEAEEAARPRLQAAEAEKAEVTEQLRKAEAAAAASNREHEDKISGKIPDYVFCMF
jgi:hypothetical protein